MAVLVVGFAGPSVGGLTACETSCSVDAEGHAEVVEDGIIDVDGGVYESAAWDGTWRKFPPKKRYEFRHGLGGTPREVVTYVSFSEHPFGRDRNGSAAESAGNIVIIEEVTSEAINVRNDTCETFYLRVFASDPTSDAATGTPDAGGGAGGSGSAPEG